MDFSGIDCPLKCKKSQLTAVINPVNALIDVKWIKKYGKLIL